MCRGLRKNHINNCPEEEKEIWAALNYARKIYIFLKIYTFRALLKLKQQGLQADTMPKTASFLLLTIFFPIFFPFSSPAGISGAHPSARGGIYKKPRHSSQRDRAEPRGNIRSLKGDLASPSPGAARRGAVGRALPPLDPDVGGKTGVPVVGNGLRVAPGVPKPPCAKRTLSLTAPRGTFGAFFVPFLLLLQFLPQ